MQCNRPNILLHAGMLRRRPKRDTLRETIPRYENQTVFTYPIDTRYDESLIFLIIMKDKL